MKRKIVEANHIFTDKLILPGVLEQAIEHAISSLDLSPLGTLLFGSALNLLLFNEKYKARMIDSVRKLLESNGPHKMMFTVSNHVFEADVRIREKAGDNLMFTSLDADRILRLRVKRMKSVPYSNKDTVIKIDPKKLEEIESVARKSRTKNVKASKEIP